MKYKSFNKQKNITCHRRIRASVTVEATLVLPVFICGVLALCFLFQIMETQLLMQRAINTAAEDIASYGYVYNVAESSLDQKKQELLAKVPMGETIYGYLVNYADDYAVKLLVSQYIPGSELEKRRIAGGWKSVSFRGSSIRDSENCVCVYVSYKINLPFLGNLLPAIEIKQAASAGLFSGRIAGHKETEQESETVYVAISGKVYHTDRDCSYLKLKISEVQKTEVSKKRNYKGGKYYPCEHCAKKVPMPDTVYITYEGDRYHTERDCMGIKRTILEIKKDETDLPLCSRCAAKDLKEDGEE